MTGDETTDPYLLARVHEALVADARLHEQAVEVALVSVRRIAVRGEVATPARREAALELIRTLSPDVEIVDELRVTPIGARPRVEQL